jgi:hypothetical protein
MQTHWLGDARRFARLMEKAAQLARRKMPPGNSQRSVAGTPVS